MAKRKPGPRSPYDKTNAQPRTVLLSPLAAAILDAANTRANGSASNVIDHLLRLHGGRVTAADLAPVTEEITQ